MSQNPKLILKKIKNSEKKKQHKPVKCVFQLLMCTNGLKYSEGRVNRLSFSEVNLSGCISILNV